MLTLLNGFGPLLVLAAIVAVAAYDLRVSLFLVFFVLYFGGYPSIQFAARHYFHLELITWAALGLLLQGLLVRRPAPAGALRRIGILCGVIVALVASLGAIRLYQAAQARRLFAEYERAAKTPIPFDASRRDADGFIHIPGPSKDADVRLLEVDVDAFACDANASVDFRYDARQPSNNYSRQVSIPRSSGHSLTRVLAAIYAPAFQGVQVPAGRDGCVAGVYWVDTARQPLVLDVTLAPDWERRVLYQRMPFEPAFGAQ